MAKIPVWMDLIAGILLAVDFIPKNSTLTKIYKWTQKALLKSNQSNPASGYTMLTNFVISVFLFVMLLSWAWYKSSNEPASNIGPEIGLFALGTVAGFIVITGISMLFNKIFKRYLLFMVPTAVVLVIISLVAISKHHTSVHFVVAAIAFIYMCILIPLSMTILDTVKRAFLEPGEIDKPSSYIYAKIGLFIFVMSKVIELVVK